MAVRLEHNILIIGGQWNSNNVIWTYNLYTEQWKKHVIVNKNHAPPETLCACAVAIEQDVYMFGGKTRSKRTNALWKLAGSSVKCFKWSNLPIRDSLLPSPREQHSGWEHAGKLWIFGGFSDRTQDRYLDDHGDFIYNKNNQLLCFNPYGNVWTNPQCFGAVPPPSDVNVCSTSGDKIWLLNTYSKKLYHFDKCSLVWTQFKAERVQVNYSFCTLTSVTSSRLVCCGDFKLYYGPSGLKKTQVLDLPTQTFSGYTSNSDYARGYHTATIGLNNDTVIIGGDQHYAVSSHLMFEPKSLQQLAMKTIYTYRTVLPWGSLPNKLIGHLEI